MHYSAQILFQELRASRGYAGGYDTVRNAVRPLRMEAAAQALTQRRFETEPGQQAQVDWGQVRTRFSDPLNVPAPTIPAGAHSVEVRDLAVYEQMLEVA